MKYMIWKVHDGTWRCPICLTTPIYKVITDMKYCPNCGAKATAYETVIYKDNDKKVDAVLINWMEED